jgi:hypothetical protein
MPMALRKSPYNIDQEYNQEPVFSYVEKVQPIFDRHCISCHDFQKPAASNLILAGDRNPYFNASYVDLHVKKLIRCIGGGPAQLQQAYAWGSVKSRLVEVLKAGHQNVMLSREEMETLYTWIDLNGVYYGSYESAYPHNPAGRSPLTAEELDRLGKLTGVNFSRLAGFNRSLGPQISFERPELSPCLAGLQRRKSYDEALQIIQMGKQRLQETPRADMENFVPCEQHLTQLDKYNIRLQYEEENRKAISEGRSFYESATNAH